jgi:hypothetical protein
MRLAYVSEAQDAMGRAWGRSRRVARKLDPTADTETWLPRPKGMHQRTYERLLLQLAAARDAKDSVWMVGAARLLRFAAQCSGM